MTHLSGHGAKKYKHLLSPLHCDSTNTFAQRMKLKKNDMSQNTFCDNFSFFSLEKKNMYKKKLRRANMEGVKKTF